MIHICINTERCKVYPGVFRKHLRWRALQQQLIGINYCCKALHLACLYWSTLCLQAIQKWFYFLTLPPALSVLCHLCDTWKITMCYDCRLNCAFLLIFFPQLPFLSCLYFFSFVDMKSAFFILICWCKVHPNYFDLWGNQWGSGRMN